MVVDSLIRQIEMCSPKDLSQVFRGIYETYRQRLCEQWELQPKYVWWVSERVGETLCIEPTSTFIDGLQLCYIVDNAITFDDFVKYDNFVHSEFLRGRAYPRINFWNWFERGCRPEHLLKRP